MSEKKTYVLTSQHIRQNASHEVINAPNGYIVEIRPDMRTDAQNRLQWPYLTAFSKQLQWPVNGRMERMTPYEWKDVLTAAFKKESARLAMGLDGGVVMLGMRTSKMPKPLFSEWIEFLIFVAADRNIKI